MKFEKQKELCMKQSTAVHIPQNINTKLDHVTMYGSDIINKNKMIISYQ